MSISQEADILDVVRRLRQTVNSLDNANFLSDKVNMLGDPMLSILVEKAVARISSASELTSSLLKHIENNRTYKEIVKKYRAPSVEVTADDATEIIDE